MALNGKYLEDAERLLAQGDYPQASEKLWGAVATAIKTVATIRGWRHYTHRQLHDAIRRLQDETGDSQYGGLFSLAESLHANFYENFLEAGTLTRYADSARTLVSKLHSLIR